jgi:hypothetical protein
MLVQQQQQQLEQQQRDEQRQQVLQQQLQQQQVSGQRGRVEELSASDSDGDGANGTAEGTGSELDLADSEEVRQLLQQLADKEDELRRIRQEQAELTAQADQLFAMTQRPVAEQGVCVCLPV